MFYNQQATMTVADAIEEPSIEEVVTVKTEPKKPYTYKPPVLTSQVFGFNIFLGIELR